ncbi:MFS transporter [Roseomonas fluvialis]|uniref:MFS transporter n=1 Tax=Roseomonas fluvialis TaxID=1750527 RepID=A0ABN6P7H6_9PROT|nr:MFS transporter [Roseomonas fluvialis]BDG74641.1 MFS transporter [Roseomonas fluvialis]
MADRFFGWQVVWAAFALASFAWGIGFYGPGVWLHALAGGRGWSVAAVSGAITLHFLASALLVARLPAVQARLGLVAMLRAGLVLSAGGAVAWAAAPAPAWLVPAALLTGAGWAMTSGAAINAIVSRWFDRRRPAALAMAYNGASMGGIVFVPLWAALIGGIGFLPAAIAIGAIGMAVLWPVVGRWFAPDPAMLGQHADGAAAPPAPRAAAGVAGSLWSQPGFRSLSMAFALGMVGQMGLLSQVYSLMTPALGVAGAGWAVSLATVCAVLGRTAVGWLLPSGASRRGAAALNFLVQAAGSVALLAAGGTSAPLLVLACVLFGLGLGNLLSLPPLIAQAEWPAAQVGAVVALITAVNQAFYAFAPAIFGLLREVGGDWTVGAAALVLQLAAAAVLRGRR